MFQKIKSFLFSFFHFNKQERNGLFVLILILFLLLIFKIFVPFIFKNDTKLIFKNLELRSNRIDTSNFEKQIDSFKKIEKNTAKAKKELFVFNPNTITFEEAQKLGLSKKISSTLINFRNKGGKFYKSSDLKKLYGISEDLFAELESYILIPETKKEQSKVYQYNNNTSTPKFKKNITELNSADSLEIVYLSGIGPSFTKRILKYRAMLGGFHNVIQLKEVYGMTDSLYTILIPQIQIDITKITTMPINSIDLNSLRKHPYLNFQTAQAIYNYRFKHGKLTEKDIIDLGIFNSEKLDLLLPYFSY